MFNAKSFLMEPYPGFEEDFYKKNNLQDPLQMATEDKSKEAE